MSRNPSALPSQPFPECRPAVDIHPIDVESFAVDCRELPGWFAIPEVGDVTLWSIYDPPDWHLASVTAMVGVRPAWVHDLQSVETEASEWEPGTGWQPGTWLMFARARRIGWNGWGTAAW